IAPIIDAINDYNNSLSLKTKAGNLRIDHVLVHTGQHYDEFMSRLFFDELGIPKPDIDLEVGSASHAVQTAEIMKRFETVILKEKPNLILVVGDVNSTIACALVASKLGVKIAHVEAGLRSYDRTMPEEINRVLTDAVSDLLFTTERAAEENLLKEGIPLNKIHFVGNVMIDTLLKNQKKAESSDILERLQLKNTMLEPYGVLTLHRPSNVDEYEQLLSILDALSEVSQRIPIVFPIHPKTRNSINNFGLNHYLKTPSSYRISSRETRKSGIIDVQPLGYLDFLHLISNAKIVLTDSGGIQEETTVLGVPCITLRENTERPITISQGTNVLTGINKDKIVNESMKILHGEVKKATLPEYWDGKAAYRIVDIIARYFKG
ncbi:MAG TPA: UDP-N-acetylglucosamine 2-epimerase (non-hydrolyzing), partial [Candidatus Brocadiaceae bacterium]